MKAFLHKGKPKENHEIYYSYLDSSLKSKYSSIHYSIKDIKDYRST